MTYETYPLSALAIAEENVRHTSQPDDGIPALAQMIADTGLQQPLCGYKKGRTKLLIYDGRRRLLALQHLAQEDRLPKDCLDGIPCRIGSKADARAASLGAGLGAKGFHPTEAFRQFAALIEEGQTVPDIAKRFSLSEREVEQRLRLARLAPPIFDAFAEDAITVEQAMAYALIDDPDRQMRVFETGGTDLPARMIRRQLTDGETPGTDKRVRLVGLAAYEAAGGRLRRDLFSDEDDLSGVTLLDEALLDDLTHARLLEAEAALRAEGWSWVKASVHADYDLYQTHGRVRPERQPLPEDAQHERDTLVARRDALAGTAEHEDELDDETWAEIERLDAALEDLDAQHTAYSREDLARGGATVSIRPDGSLDIVRGLVPRKALTPKPEKPALPHAVHRQLTERASQALARDLASHAETADLLLTAVMAQAAWSYGPITGIGLRGEMPRFTEGGTLPPDEALAARIDAAKAQVGRSLAETVENVAALADDQRADLRQLALSCLLDLSEMRGDTRSEDGRSLGTFLARRMGTDLTRHWQPDETYFGRLSRDQIITALTEMGVPTKGLEKAKKADLVPVAARKAQEAGWLPEPLRFAHAPDGAAG